jgi:hypothetical protein
MANKISENLRKMASELRKKSEENTFEKTVKCAKIIIGATALEHLKQKLKQK